MKYLKFFFFSCSIFCFHTTLLGQNKLVRLNLEGKEYKKVSLSSPYENVRIKGNSKDGASWEFPVSEDQYNKMMTFEFIFDGSSDNKMVFYYVQDKDTFKTTSLGIDIVELNATYSFSYERETPVLVVKEGINASEMRSWQMDVYLVKPEKDSYSELFFKYLLFGFFRDQNEDEKSYEDFMEEYVLVCQQYPESQFLLARLWNLRSRFRSKKHIRTLFDLLSVDRQNSYYGEMIKEYLQFNEQDFYFENVRLRDCTSLEEEYIITNPEKHTLIIFSAWWCGPCHALLPDLKEIYKDVKESIDFVYVSIDKEETFSRWQNYIVEENIPWRCLWLNDENKESPGVGLMEEYFISGIPDLVLVSPGGKSRKLGVIREGERNLMKYEDRSLLYEILNKD